MMPKMDGFEVIDTLRQQPKFHRLPIVVLSARSELSDRLKGLEIGVNAYISKPFNVSELLLQVQNLLDLKSKREGTLTEDQTEEQLTQEDRDLQTLIAFVQSRISESTIKAAVLAEEINVSRSSLYRMLKSTTGFTPAEFVRELKLQQAREIREADPHLTVAELADRVGFSNASYFSRLYKERFGKRPS
jgi:DNA-binding response OmpR family regulator